MLLSQKVAIIANGVIGWKYGEAISNVIAAIVPPSAKPIVKIGIYVGGVIVTSTVISTAVYIVTDEISKEIENFKDDLVFRISRL